MENRGFAKLTDKDHYWRVCRYIALEKRRTLDTAFIQEECECEEEDDEEEEEVPDWEEPNEDTPYEYGFTHSVADADAFESSIFDSQILDLLSDDEEINFVFEPSLDISPPLDVPNCDYTIYTNWRHADNLLNPIMASHIFPNITLLDVVDDKSWTPMPIPNLLIGVNCMYETSPSQKWMDWL